MTNFDYWASGIDLWHWRKQAQTQAIEAGISVAEVDWLLQALTPLDRLALRLESFKTQTQIPLKRSLLDLTILWQKRLQQKVPVQYLAGSTPWRRFSLKVAPGVLIPRPETELLIDLATSAIQQSDLALQQGHWADLGSGSGAIAIGLADVLPRATLHAVDQSEAALEIARQNAQAHGFNQIQFYAGSWFEPLIHLRGSLSGMVSNPPYIPTALIATLQPEVAQHEPHTALDGGIDGLNCIRHLVASAPDYLIPGGVWLIEMMAGQSEAVSALLQAQGNYRAIQIHPDLAGMDRFALAYRK